jgi:RNA polymerase sigma-70 factor, ECF subfamily
MTMVRARGARAAEIEAIYRDRFTVFVLSITAVLRDGEEALDVVQEGFSRALRRRRSFRGDGKLESWIWRIVLNVAADRGRAREKAHQRGTEERAATDPDRPDDVIRRQLRALPERQRLAVFLRYYADLSYDEIAEVLEVRPGTVAASLNAAHRTLRSELAEVVT